MNTYTTHYPTEIPPIGKTKFHECFEVSETFYATVRTISNEISKSTVRYDHNRKKWLIGTAGGKEVIEYYTFNIDERFSNWVHKNYPPSDIPLDNLRELYDSMDEEDK